MSLIQRLADALLLSQNELEPRIPEVTAADVERVISRDFPADSDAVHEILNEYGGEAWEREPARVKLAVLKLANGSVEKLREAVTIAKADYRDVLGPAEYPTSTFGVSLRASKRKYRQIQESNWKQYQQWLRK